MRKKILLLVGMSSILAPIAGCKNNIKDPDKWDLSTEDIQNAVELAAPTYKINYQNNTITYVFHLGNEGIIKDSVNKEDILITDKSKLTSSDVNGKFFHKDAIVNAEVVTSKHNLGATNGDSTIEIETPYNEESDPMLIIDKSVSTLGEYFICPAFDVDNKALNMDINDYSSKIIEQDYTAEIKGIINIASSIAMIAIGMGSENPATAVSGVTSLLNTMFGMFGSEVSNAQLLKEIYIIQAQLKEVIGKLDNIEKTLNELKVITQCGFDQAYLLQIEGNWNNFISSYYDPNNRNMNEFSTTLASYFSNYIKDSKEITLKYRHVNEYYNLIAPYEDDYEYPDYETTINVDEFKEAKKYLQNNVVQKGFVDAVIKDLEDNVTSTVKSSKAIAIDAYNAISNNFAFNEYYSSDVNSPKYSKALNVYQTALDFMDHISGNYIGGQSILNDAYKRLTLMYNFAKEVKPIWTNFLATVKCYVTYFAQLAQTAALAAHIPQTDLNKKMNEASDKIQEFYYREINLEDNYSYIINGQIGTRVGKVWAATTATSGNHPTINESFEHRTLNFYGYNEGNYVEVPLNLSQYQVLSTTDVFYMGNRYKGIVEQYNPNVKFINYLCGNDVMDSYTNYYPQRGWLKNMSNGFLTGMEIRDMQNYQPVKCVWRSNGDYFEKGGNYFYQQEQKEIEAKYWNNGKTLNGTLVNADNGTTVYEEPLAGYCRYWEDHALWFNAEIWGFTLRTEVTHYWFLYVE